MSAWHLCRTREAGKLASEEGGLMRSTFVCLAICLALGVAQPALAAAPPATFPAQQRPPGDPAVIARGGSLYAIQCRSCHGVDLRGGDLGGPNLLRSQLVLNDQAGEAIGPVVMNGRNLPGGKVMPALPLPRADIDAIAEYIHSVAASAQPQGAPPPGAKVELNLLVGNAKSGERYFAAQCASCHSVTGDLAGIAGRVPGIGQLQDSWVSGRHAGAPSTVPPRVAQVTVKFADGSASSGTLLRMDDFIVSLRTQDGQYRSYTRRHATPRITAIDVSDPMAGHRNLFTRLSDDDMHNVTAYLATLK
jgi:cytochrome c oxidase cbb3-type subunit 3